MPMKRRILEELTMTEISGVDRPCQEGARVALFKRAPVEKFNPNHDARGRFSAALGAVSGAASAAASATRRLTGTLTSTSGLMNSAKEAINSKNFVEAGRHIDQAIKHFVSLLASVKGFPKEMRALGAQLKSTLETLRNALRRKMEKSMDAETEGLILDVEAKLVNLNKVLEDADVKDVKKTGAGLIEK